MKVPAGGRNPQVFFSFWLYFLSMKCSGTQMFVPVLGLLTQIMLMPGLDNRLGLHMLCYTMDLGSTLW